MVRTSRIALALGLIVLAAASSTAAGASGPPVVLTEAGGAGPAPDPRWVARASTYDTACSASDADPAEHVARDGWAAAPTNFGVRRLLWP